MPILTKKQKAIMLGSRNLSPAEWDITPDLQVVPVVSQQPSVSGDQEYQQKPTDMLQQQQQQSLPSTTPLQAFGSSFAQGAIPAVASGGGFMAGASPMLPWNAAAIAAAPETAGISLAVPLISGLIGGGIAGYGANKIQQAVEPQQWQNYAAQAQQEHPTASLLGGISTMPLAGMSPNPMNVVRAGGTLGKLATRILPSINEAGMAAPIAPQELSNLMNVGQGSIISALQPNVEALAQGQPLPDAKENIINLLTGAVFNTPNAIGRKIGSLTGHPNMSHNADNRDPYAAFKEAAQSVDAGNTEQTTANETVANNNQTVPEPASALSWQLNRLSEGKRKAVLIPTGAKLPTDIPSGFTVTDTDAGSFIHDPNKLSSTAIKAAVKDNKIGRLLDYGIEAKPEGANTAVVIRDKVGNELLSVVTDDANRPRVYKKLSSQANAKNGETVSVIPAEEVIAGRLQSIKRAQDYQQAQQDIRNRQIESANKLRDIQQVKSPTIEELQNAPTVNRPPAVSENTLNIVKPAIERNLNKGGAVARPEIVEATPSHQERLSTGEVVNRYPQQEATIEARNREQLLADKELAPTESELAQERLESTPRAERFQQEDAQANRPFTEQERDTVEKMGEQGLPHKPSEQWYNLLKKWGANLRGVSIKEGKPVNEQGKEVAGEALIRQGIREVVLNKDKSGFDTAPHEIFHWFINDMEHNGSNKEKAIVKKYYDLISNSDEFKKINETRLAQGREAWTPNEYATTQQGMEFLRNVLSLKGETGFQAWKKDMAASLRTKYGSKATHEDYTRLMGHRFLNDPSYSVSAGSTSVGNKNLQQDEPITTDKIVKRVATVQHPQVPGDKGYVQIDEFNAKGENVRSTNPETLSKEGVNVPSRDELMKLTQGKHTLDSNPQSEESAFLLSGPRIIDELNVSDKGINGKQWEGVINNRLNPTEKEIYKKAGLNEFLSSKERITPTELKSWMRANGPKIEVHSYGMEGKISEAKKEYDRMTHEWLEQLPMALRPNINSALMRSEPLAKALVKHYGWTKENAQQAEKYSTLAKQVGREEQTTSNSPRATSYYETVSALDTKQPMPEWTTTKSGRNVQRVDVVVPQDKEGRVDKYGEKMPDYNLWTQDNLHENLPNTLGWAMIQYKTGPKGEKIAVIAEAQSRWGQERRNLEQKLKQDPMKREITVGEARVRDHPLLRDYNRLILKAAIDQARKEGATHIMVSDAETAMMTERHDAHSHTMWNDIGGLREPVDESYITQAKGMRLNYDTILPKIAEELTGAKGEKVSLGEHKNAMEKVQVESGPTVTGDNRNEPRSNLIFRNPDGTPKTDVSGLMYPLSDKLQKQFSMFERKYSEESPFERKSFLPFLTSRIDKIDEKLRSPTSRMVTEQLHKLSGETDLMTGRIGNRMIAATQDYPAHMIDRVYKYLYQMDDNGISSINLNPTERKLATTLTEIIREPRKMQIDMGLQVKTGKGSMRIAGIKPEGYMFNMLDPKVAYTWAEQPNSKEAKLYDKQYVDHLMQHGVSEQEALTKLHEYKGALGNNVEKDNEFGAIRKAEGKGLPWQLADKNFASAAIRYGRRAARDLMYFKYIENDPKMRKALNVPDQFGVLPERSLNPEIENIGATREVKDAMRSVYGIDMPRNPVMMATARAASNAVMGIGTAARNIANMPSFIANYVQLKQLPIVVKAITHMNDSRVRAFENNATKASYQDFDAAGYYEGNPNPAIRLLDKFSSLSRKYQGRDLSNKFEGEFYYSLGELLTTDNIARAKQGDKEAIAFVKRFGDIVEGDILKRKVTQDDIGRVSKRFTDAARGTYGEEGLPSWAIEGEIAPFAALSRFSIEKSNTIWKDVIMPAKQGNYGPLLRYSLGSLGVGLIIEQMNELLTGKKGNEATVNEILASGNEAALSPKAISLLQMASFAGIIGDGAQLASRAMQGKSIKYNVPLSSPLYSLVTDTLAGNIANAAQAINEGEDPFNTLASLVTAISTQSVQTMRYIDSNLVHKDETQDKNKQRDLRVFNELEGNPSTGTSVQQSNPFVNAEAKEFKNEQDVTKLGSELTSILQKYMKEYGNNPEMLRKKLEALKSNSYPTMPSPESMPRSFSRYLAFLNKTEGAEVAAHRLEDYMMHRGLNAAKSSMVPSL